MNQIRFLGRFTWSAAVLMTAAFSQLTCQESGTRVSLAWTFEPTATERRFVEEALTRQPNTGEGPSWNDAEVYRFGTRRYLIVSSERVAGAVRIPHVVLYSLGPEEALSRPFDTRVFDHPGRFATLQIKDLDGDGALDFPFCGWTSDAVSSSFVLGVGYSDGIWYVLDDTKIAPPPCPARDVP